MNRFPPLQRRLPTFRDSAILALACYLLALNSACEARSLTFHGPIIEWNEDPCTTAIFTWVEEIAPDAVTVPVWRKGNAGFGYGDGDDTTVLDDMKDNYKRLYLAKTFKVASVPKNGVLRLAIRYDDAFIAFINGREVARSNNIEGYHATAKVTDDHEAKREEIFEIRNLQRFLKPGINHIAIEGHNVKTSSSDLTFQPRLFLDGKKLIAHGAEWHYLAGGDPSIRWHLKMPSVVPIADLPMMEESEWTLSIRPRGSGREFKAIKHDTGDFGGIGDPVFHAKITGLQPGTAYDYNLSAGSHSVRTGWFETAPDRLTKPMRFIVGGDMGTNTAIPMCRAAGRDDPMFVAIGGDFAYANGRSPRLWYDWIDNWVNLVVAPDGRSIPIVAAIGNHETRSFSGLKKHELWKGLAYLKPKKSRAPFYFTMFDLPGDDANFTIDFSDYMSIVVLDSGHAQKEKSQTGWLEKQLKERIQVPNLFALYHKPAWGAGIKKNDEDVQEEWCPLFEKYQIDCAFENDHHCYKRSHPLTRGVRDDARGILYLGDGAWGATLRPITDRMLDRQGARHYLAKWKSIHHANRVTIYPDGTRLYQAIDSHRSVFDSLRDTKKRRRSLSTE